MEYRIDTSDSGFIRQTLRRHFFHHLEWIDKKVKKDAKTRDSGTRRKSLGVKHSDGKKRDLLILRKLSPT